MLVYDLISSMRLDDFPSLTQTLTVSHMEQPTSSNTHTLSLSFYQTYL